MAGSAAHDIEPSAIRRRLRAWYRRHARDLPWRRRRDAYAIWLSEIMLQQTQVATVIPYFATFLQEFPEVADLARAERSTVLRLWAGLGYYRRAHQLHAAAQHVVREYGGEFPKTVEGLLTLPGVGRYTAGAIASIAFDCRAPILDGNVKRVLARLTASPASPDDPREIRRLWSLAEALLPRRGSGDFNQALMDLGATVCTPRDPDCARCPLARDCAAHLSGRTAEIPRPKARARVQPLKLTCFVVTAGDRVLLTERAAGGLWAGTQALPAGESVNGNGLRSVARELLPVAVLRRIRSWQPAGEVRHRLTHRDVTVEVHAAAIARVRVPAPYRWSGDGDHRVLPTVFRKVLRLEHFREFSGETSPK
ncbi:MAG: A/G-specific adenine glycosylase [Phycisphaerales bacterium]|nr:A/G-specific adenine glycosylase [Phycisphaerales bacterium]